ncbi:MAG: lipopolysaccharide assembly protein LapA domain-containing protein [Firmicutes bacterium]|nr:lipopolysaccharide assembly protein LapA domain-containing protein [Bacillota bacterium]
MAGRWLKLIGRVVILILIVVVALQNRGGVQLRAFWWALPHVPLAVVVLLAVLVGIILGGLGVWWSQFRRGGLPSVGRETASFPEPTSEPAAPALSAQETKPSDE